MDDQVLDELEEVLITSDVGVDTTIKIIERIEERVARDKYLNTTGTQPDPAGGNSRFAGGKPFPGCNRL